VALWTCRCAWTTRRALPTCPQQEQQKTNPPSRDSRLTTRLRRCQKPDSQNASRPGRHQIGMVGEIISESWARSNRNTRARSSESAPSRTATASSHRAVDADIVFDCLFRVPGSNSAFSTLKSEAVHLQVRCFSEPQSRRAHRAAYFSDSSSRDRRACLLRRCA